MSSDLGQFLQVETLTLRWDNNQVHRCVYLHFRKYGRQAAYEPSYSFSHNFRGRCFQRDLHFSGPTTGTFSKLTLTTLRVHMLKSISFHSLQVILVNVVHLRDPVCPLPTSILAQYLKQSSGQLSCLKVIPVVYASSSLSFAVASIFTARVIQVIKLGVNRRATQK